MTVTAPEAPSARTLPAVQIAGLAVVVVTGVIQVFADLYYRHLGLDSSAAGVDAALLTARVGYACAAVAAIGAAAPLGYWGWTWAHQRLALSRPATFFGGLLVGAAGMIASAAVPWDPVAALLLMVATGVIAAGFTGALDWVAVRVWVAVATIATLTFLVPVVSTAARDAAGSVARTGQLPEDGWSGVLVNFAGLDIRELHRDSGTCSVVVAIADDAAWTISNINEPRAPVARAALNNSNEIRRPEGTPCG